MNRLFLLGVLSGIVLCVAFLSSFPSSDSTIPPTPAVKTIKVGDGNVTAKNSTSSIRFIAEDGLEIIADWFNDLITFGRVEGVGINVTIPDTLESLTNVTDDGCLINQIRLVNGSGWWICSDVSAGAGGVTTLESLTNVTDAGCGTNQVRKAVGSVWVCADDITGISTAIIPANIIISVNGSNYQANNGTNGILLYSGTNFATIINNAITDTREGLIFITAGNYTLTTSIDLTNKNNLKLVGAGSGTNITFTGGSLVHAIQTTNTITYSGLEISNLKLVGAGSGNSGDGIHLKFVDNPIIRNVEIVGFGTGGDGAAVYATDSKYGILDSTIIKNSQNGYITRQTAVDLGHTAGWRIVNNFIYNSTDDALHPQSGRGNIIQNNIIHTFGDNALDLFGDVNSAIIANVITNGTSSTRAAIEAGDSSTGCIIMHNNIYNNTGDGINILTSSECVIADNTITTSKRGITTDPTGGTVLGLTISANKIYNNTQNGMLLSGTKRASVIGNVIIDNGLGGAGGTTQRAIQIENAASDVLIFGNQLHDKQSTPTQEGIRVAAGVSNVDIQSNNFGTLLNFVINDAGTSTIIRNNRGYTSNDDTVTTNGANQTISKWLTFTDNQKIILDPSATNPSLNLGTIGSEPTSLVNGDIWINSLNQRMRTYIAGVTREWVDLSYTQSLQNKGLQDSNTNIFDNSDTTKKLTFQISGISTAHTQTWTAQDKNGTVILTPSNTTALIALHLNETDQTQTVASTDTTVRTYSLPANSYSHIMVEAEVEVSFGVLSTPQDVLIKIKDGGTTKETFTTHSLAQVGESALTVKVSFVQAGASTITITQSAAAADANTNVLVHSIRIYGIT